MRLTANAIPLLAAGAFAMACGTAPDRAAAAGCDRYASPASPGSAQRLADGLQPGQTGCLRGGEYSGTGSEGYVLRIARGGRERAPITIRSAPGERAKLHGIVYVVRGADHFALKGVDLDGRHPRNPGQSQNSLQLMASDTVVANSDITNHQSRSCAIIGAGARRTIIRHNVFHDCGDPGNGLLDHAIYVQSASGTRIVDNVFLRSAGWAVQLYPRATRSYVARNLMWENGGGVVFGGDGGEASSRNLVESNVMGASRRRPELTSSYGDRIGRRNVARANCLAPGLGPSDRQIGFRMVANRVASGPACVGTAPAGLVSELRGLAPALVARLTR